MFFFHLPLFFFFFSSAPFKVFNIFRVCEENKCIKCVHTEPQTQIFSNLNILHFIDCESYFRVYAVAYKYEEFILFKMLFLAYVMYRYAYAPFGTHLMFLFYDIYYITFLHYLLYYTYENRNKYFGIIIYFTFKILVKSRYLYLILSYALNIFKMLIQEQNNNHFDIILSKAILLMDSDIGTMEVIHERK